MNFITNKFMPKLKSIFRNIIFWPHPVVISPVGLPLFPEFKKLELSDKEAVEKITHKFPSYSDFNFTKIF